MTSRERFEAEFVKLGGHTSDLRRIGESYFYTDTFRAFKYWQAAERDMLERCVEVLTRYNDCSDAYEELKELLNEPR